MPVSSKDQAKAWTPNFSDGDSVVMDGLAGWAANAKVGTMVFRFLPVFLVFCTTGLVRADDSADQQFTKLLDRIWASNMENYPEWATSLGKRTGLDRWTDNSEEALRAREAQSAKFLAELKAIDASALSPSLRLDHRLLVRDYERDVEGQRFPGEYLALNQLGGAHEGIVQLMDIVPAEQPEDFEALLKRLEAVPVVIDQNIALLQKGLEKGVTPPQITLGKVAEQIEALTVDDSLENPILAPFRKDTPRLSAEEKKAFQERGLKALRERVLPALKKFHTFAKDTYVPGARKTLGMSALPDGEAWYAYSAAGSTTTNLTPKEIHEIGLREVARIEAEMEALKDRIGFKGSLAEFAKFLREDPQFYYTKPGELLAGYRDICKRADAELPRLFGKLPRMTYGVKAVPEYAALSKPTAYYEGGSLEAARPGYFVANTSKLDSRPKWEMTALALHEAVPGHHLQIALAQEMGEKHELLRERFYTAYIEGWGLYAESLGAEMGMYEDPYADFGRLTYEMWRAVRLVVDTGLHAMGWTREQASEYFRTHTAKADHDIAVEVDRYLVWPGQALAYKIGQLKILELRQRAEKELGRKFDIRKFHDTVLAEGAVPLDVLDERITAWIAGQKKE
jgi:uncharacterized protein (DUF885 family)